MYLPTVVLMLGYMQVVGYFSRRPHQQSHVQVDLCFAFFVSTHLSTHEEPQLVHASLHKMYPQVFFEQVVLRVLAELTAREITHIACKDIGIFLQVLIKLYCISIAYKHLI